MRLLPFLLALPLAWSGAATSVCAEEPALDAVRAATERFRNVEVALAEGYVRDPMNLCDTAEMMGRPASLGAMGIHFFRPDLLGITAPPNPRVEGDGTHTDFLRPSILIYEPQADGRLELVAVENLVFERAWFAAGHSERPSFHGVPYDHMFDDPATEVDEAHMFERHFDRHVWLYRDNPNGVFAPFNPAVTCEHHRVGVAAADAASHEGHSGEQESPETVPTKAAAAIQGPSNRMTKPAPARHDQALSVLRPVVSPSKKT